MEVRNLFFRIGVLKSVNFDVPVVSVGNISVGGTGKTPMVKYLIQQYGGTKTIGVLSRGYGRLTKGFLTVETKSLAKNVGDEPLEIKLQFPEITVTVCEDRVIGIAEMLAINPKIDLILLDDAFQHQYVKASVSIVLTTYGNPFTKDFVVPMGRLREFRHNINRADILIYTKSPSLDIPIPESEIPTFLSQTKAEQKLELAFGNHRDIKKPIVVSGLSDNAQFQNVIQTMYPLAVVSGFSDHRRYTITDVKQLIYDADRLDNNVITTDKDWVKLKNFVEDLRPDVSFWVQSITMQVSQPLALKQLIDDKING